VDGGYNTVSNVGDEVVRIFKGPLEVCDKKVVEFVAKISQAVK
jgi:hypothetical protein